MRVESEREIDDCVIAQANDELAWTDAQTEKCRSTRRYSEESLEMLKRVSKLEPNKVTRTRITGKIINND